MQRGYSKNMPQRMGGKPGGKKKESRLLILACLLLALNMIFMLRLQMQVKSINNALKQVLNRVVVSQRVEDDLLTPEENEVLNRELYAKSEEAVRVDEVDYVSLCGLPEVDKPVNRSERQVLQRLEELAEENKVIEEICKNTSLYPENMLEALANNPEMADFVKNYPSSDGKVGGGLTSAEKEQDYPLFLQWDPRWGYVEYGDESNIGLSGCGPTCLAMTLFYLLRDESITPDKIAAYSMENDYYMKGTGTTWALLEDVAALYGVQVSQPKSSEANIKDALDRGGIVICSMGPGDFTAGGHFIVIYGYDEEGFYINDSNCVARSREKWPFERIRKQIKNVWVYSKGTASDKSVISYYG